MTNEELQAKIEDLAVHAARTDANLDKMMALFRITHASIKSLENIAFAHEQRLDDLEEKL